MPASWPLFAVLGSAFVYTIAALCTKRALSGGATVWQVNFATNMAMAVLYLPFWLGVDFPRLLAQGCKPIVAAITFFIGQLFTFAALRKGDVSVATPLLGAKVIFVALLTSVLFGEAVGIKWFHWYVAVKSAGWPLATASWALMARHSSLRATVAGNFPTRSKLSIVGGKYASLLERVLL